MRYALTDSEWRLIEPILPCKPRGVPRVDDRRVLNGISRMLRSGTPWRDLPERYGPDTTCYNRFVQWRPAFSAGNCRIREICARGAKAVSCGPQRIRP
jgi:transposase